MIRYISIICFIGGGDMTINCYKYNGEPLKYDKSSKTAIGTAITIDPLSIIDLLSPVFVISYTAALAACTYVECSDLGRSYFCKPSINTAGQIVLSCSVDYISSFNLDNCPVNVVRNGNIEPNEITDNKLFINPDQYDVTTLSLDSTLFDKDQAYSYVLATVST